MIMHTKKLERFLEQVQQICSERGIRLTPQRKEVLGIIHSAEQPLGAYDILEKMAQDGRKPAPPTVYRALEFLLGAHLIHKLETLHAYVACSHPDHPHSSQFLICNECGEVDELESAGLDGTLSDLAQARGFRAESQTIEVKGTCADCSDK